MKNSKQSNSTYKQLNCDCWTKVVEGNFKFSARTVRIIFVYLMSFRIIFVNSRKTQKSRRQKYKDISSSPNLLFSPASWSTREFAGIHHIHLHWVAIVPEEIHDRSYLKLEPLVFRKIACVERVRT